MPFVTRVSPLVDTLTLGSSWPRNPSARRRPADEPDAIRTRTIGRRRGRRHPRRRDHRCPDPQSDC